MDYIKLLNNQLSEIRGHIQTHPEMKSSVSDWSVSQHCEHICLVANGIFYSLLRSAGDKKADKGLKKTMFFKARYIPRGVVKAPTFVTPKDDSTVEEINKQIDAFEKNLLLAQDADESKTSKHPLLGILSRDETINFVSIHTEHHLKIIRDILAL